jgi:hypothetical protein
VFETGPGNVGICDLKQFGRSLDSVRLVIMEPYLSPSGVESLNLIILSAFWLLTKGHKVENIRVIKIFYIVTHYRAVNKLLVF